MKKLSVLIFIVMLFSSGLLQAQSNLRESRRGSEKSYIYTINRDNLRKINLDDKSINEDMLGQYITDFVMKDGNRPDLPPGNYVIVNATGDLLHFTDYTVDDLYFKVVSSEEMMLCLYDSLGHIIDDAIVKLGSKTLKYNKVTQTYHGGNIKDEAVLEINNHGIYHYIEIEKQNHIYQASKKNVFTTTWRKMKHWWFTLKQDVNHIFHPDDRPMKFKYTGFIAFSKPRYKPGETVRLKAYMAELDGDPYTKPVDIRLHGGFRPFNIDTVLIHLSPYRPGMYEYQFTLSDSLDLKLDTHYNIELDTSNEHYNTIRGAFRYEDYELKGIQLSVKTDKTEFSNNDSVKIKVKVTDENDMAVYGGRMNVQVFHQSIDIHEQDRSLSAFIPDTLWTHTVDMGEKSEDEILLPDSIFPKNISLHYRVVCEYLSVDNEKITEYAHLHRKAKDYVLDFSLNKGMLTIQELYRGQSQPVMAHLEISGEYGETLTTDSVLLPCTLAVPWIAADITVKTQHTEDYYFPEGTAHQLGYQFYRQNDSVYLKVDNPAHIPFWYTVRRNKKEIAKGYTTDLNYAVKEKGNAGYAMQLSYLFGEEVKRINEQLPFIQKNISMEVSTPSTVYPGQKTDILISVTDKKGKPVNDVDITAYAFTSKFKNYQMPDLAVRGKAKYAKPFQTTTYEPDENGINEKGKMTWDRWKHTMSLDTIAYYKFLYPETYYIYTEPTTDGKTFISPYLVIDGALQGVNMLWIDGRLYYSNLAEQFNDYTFPVEPGRHILRFRTYDREITVQNVVVQKGTKNILSFNVAKPYNVASDTNEYNTSLTIISKELKKKEAGKLTEPEIRALKDQLITIDNNFGWMWLPNLSNPIEIPAYIGSGQTLYYLNPVSKRKYDYRIRGFINPPVLTGPFPSRLYMNGSSDMASVYAAGKLVTHIGLEGGNHYTLYPGYQKIKNWSEWKVNTISPYTPAPDFHPQPLTVNFIRKQYEQQLIGMLSTSTGYAEVKRTADHSQDLTCRLQIHVGKDEQQKDIQPALIFIVPEKTEDIGNYQLHYGATRHFRQLPTGNMRISLVLNDSVSYSRTIHLQPYGQNYLKFDSISLDKNSETARTAFKIFKRGIKREFTRNPYTKTPAKDSIVSVPVRQEEMVFNNTPGDVVKGTVYDSQGEPVIGASVMVKGTNIGTITDFDGHFGLPAIASGRELVFSYIGYESKTVKHRPGYTYNIELKEDFQALEEVVVVGYGTQKKSTLVGSISTTELDSSLQGKSAGVILIRGSNSISDSAAPLILVNGLPYEGSLDSFDPSQIKSIHILKDASATAIYGARAANGVVMIETNAMSASKTESKGEEEPLMEAGHALRRNFHDDAFWQPRLRTDQKGEAKFEVTYPDDITSWNAYFIAVGNKKQADKKQMTIHSLKALTARLSTPRFAIRGDSLHAVGRITNHYGNSISVTRKIETDKLQEDKLDVSKSHVDYIPVIAQQGDSLTIAYSLQMANGYFDGEQRSLPILEQGMLQTYGEFKVINDTVVHPFAVDPELGPVTVYLEASSLDLFLREIAKVDDYPYMCNEQMASKIKVLLLKKHIAGLLHKEFKEDQKINHLISRLVQHKNTLGMWGWWNVSGTEVWISRHVISALLDAKEAGYEVKLDIPALSYTLEQELKGAINNLALAVPGTIRHAKKELLERLMNLKRLDASVDYPVYFHQIDGKLKNHDLTDKLKTMHALAVIGLKDKINVDSLMHYASRTLLGSTYWSNKKDDRPLHRHFMLPYGNNIDNTLMAYQVLKEVGGHEDELEKIRNYFFECRFRGSWQNTYESSRIIETIMPDMLDENEAMTDATAYLNGRKITQFPYTIQMDTPAPVKIKKQGTIPLFATVYQQSWNHHPVPESEKGFKVASVFKENKDTVSLLTAGKVAQLEVTVTVEGDAEYVQIEVPIPAGCSYDSKRGGNYGKEIHREYFKEKVVIFSNKLTEGEHVFTLELIPRYTGRYALNPAKAELMYFPTIYGNESQKTVTIE